MSRCGDDNYGAMAVLILRGVGGYLADHSNDRKGQQNKIECTVLYSSMRKDLT